MRCQISITPLKVNQASNNACKADRDWVKSKKLCLLNRSTKTPRIAQVGEVLPQANCGGCGYPGCSGFADACVKAGSLDGKFCPVGR